MTTPKRNACSYLNSRCPRCSALLMTDGKFLWCSLIEGNSFIACEFGHDRDLSVNYLQEFNYRQEPMNDK